MSIFSFCRRDGAAVPSVRGVKHDVRLSQRACKKSVFLCFFCWAMIAGTFVSHGKAGAEAELIKPTEVSARLHGALMKADRTRLSRNMVFSPFSILRAFRVLEAGTSGPTLEQMRRLFDESCDQLDLPDLSSDHPHGRANRIVVQVADRLYVHPLVEHDPVFQEYKKKVKEAFGVDVLVRDFWKDPRGVASEINSFVSEVTSSRINHIVSPLDFSPNTKLAVVNALYIKAPWRFPFKKDDSELKPFMTDVSLASGEGEGGYEKKAIFMKQRLSEGSVEFLDSSDNGSSMITAIRLEYTDPSLAMYIFMPAYSLEDFEDHLLQNPSMIDEMIEKMRHQRLIRARNNDALRKGEKKAFRSVVEFWVPRFFLSAERNRMDVVSVLKELGVHDLFKDHPDLSRLSGNTNLHLDLFRHAADISVDEEGTEAAAASFLDAADGLIRERITRQIVFDHPFLFQIRFQPSRNLARTGLSASEDVVLFSGRVVDANDAQRQS